ncbi:MAG: hypothetical protein DMG78_14930 [Acidobacteria bacterium]|nr:MAG: hypothetical protein DMG78_14930 [Acidobacteriota bacterium]
MSSFAKIVVWVCVGVAVLFTHWVTPRAVTDLRAGLAMLFVVWCSLSCLWFARQLFRFVVR